MGRANLSPDRPYFKGAPDAVSGAPRRARSSADVYPHGHAPPSPGALEALEASRQLRIAMLAVARGRQLVAQDFMPVANDHPLRTSGTERRAAGAVVHVARVHVVDPLPQRDVARTRERCGWGARQVHHLVVRMERREMQRDI